MIDFAAISQARQGLKARQDNRQSDSAALYEQGRALVAEAQADFDKQLLKQAADCFARGIQSYYGNPSNYLGMAYLFLLLGQAAKASPYLKSALELDPSSELGQQLLLQAQRAQTPEAARRPQGAHSGHMPGAVDVDEIYDQIEAAVQTFIRQLRNRPFWQMPPVIDAESYRALRREYESIEAQKRSFFERISTLEREIETAGLAQALNQVHPALQVLSGLLRASEKFMEIQRESRAHASTVLALLTRLQKGGQIAPEQVEALLDHCDGLADKLDALEAEGLEISVLKPEYRQFLRKLEALQDALEENDLA